MIYKISQEIQKNKSQLEELYKKEKQGLETIQKVATRNTEKNDTFETINHLPGYIRNLEETYFEIKNLERENKKLLYLLE